MTIRKKQSWVDCNRDDDGSRTPASDKRAWGLKANVKISLPIIQPRHWATDTQYISICKISIFGPSQATRNRNTTLKLYASTVAR